MQFPEPDQTNSPDGGQVPLMPAEQKEGRRSAMFEALKEIQPTTRVTSAQDFLKQALGISDDSGLEPFIGVIHEALEATANTAAFEQIAVLAELILAAMRSVNDRARVVTAFRGLTEGDILPVTRLLPQVTRPVPKPNGRITAIQEAATRSEVRKAITDSRSMQRPSGILKNDVLAEMLAAAKDIKEERGNASDVEPRLVEMGAKPLQEYEDLKRALIVTREFIDRTKRTRKIRIGKEEIISALERSREIQEEFAGNPNLITEPVLRERLVCLSNGLILAISKLLAKATTGVVYLSNNSRHLIGQMRAVAENICVRSPRDIDDLRRFRFRPDSAHEVDATVLKNISNFLGQKKVANPDGLANANALIGNMLETPEEKKAKEGYAEWAEIMTVTVAGEVAGNEIDLSRVGFAKYVSQAEESVGNLEPADVEKIRAIERELDRVEILHHKDVDPSKTEKKSPKQLGDAKSYARFLVARLLLTPRALRAESSTFEKIFRSKLLPHIAGSYKGAVLVDDGEQTSATAAFLDKSSGGLSFEAGIHVENGDVSEEEVKGLRAALTSDNSAQIKGAIDDVFGE